VDAPTTEGLVRAGVLRAGGKLPAKLLVPVLALDAALGMQGDRLLGQLTRLLSGSASVEQRDMVLDAIADELTEHLEQINDGPAVAAPEQLRAALTELRDTLTRLAAEDADPAQVTRVAVLCAKLIERLAPQIAPRPTRKVKERPLTGSGHDPQDLADAAWGMAVRLTSPIVVPSVEALAQIAAGPARLPQRTQRRAELGVDHRAGRTERVSAALRSSNAVAELYEGQTIDEALRRHVCVTSLGAQGLRDAGVRLSSSQTDGPQPLEWSTTIESARAQAQAA
jgi:hypothetical protein